MLQRGKNTDEPPLQPPLRNNANLLNEYDDDVASQLRNPDEGDYPNFDSINSFDMPSPVSPEY